MVGRPQIYPIKKIIGFTEEMVDAVEKWRKKQKLSPNNFSEAVRRLVEMSLEHSKKSRKHGR
jgi:hypothetical protein